MTDPEPGVAAEPAPAPDPHDAHVASGIADQDCRDCERVWEYWNFRGSGL